MITNLLKLGGYVLLAREAADFVINSQHYREKEQNREQVVATLSGCLIGLAVGVSVGLLFAPRSGKETRDMIADTACSQLDRLQSQFAEGKKQMSEVISRTKEELCATSPESSEENTEVTAA
ncbi:YtxH domain-containing protein [Desulfocastanea catecholica]